MIRLQEKEGTVFFFVNKKEAKKTSARFAPLGWLRSKMNRVWGLRPQWLSSAQRAADY